MNITLSGRLAGTVTAPPSKSDLHRALICAALADRPLTLPLTAVADDIAATLRCLAALGADIRQADGLCTVTPLVKPAPSALLDCGESASTLRFLLPVAAALGCSAAFTGTGRLPQRPLADLLHVLTSHGVTLSADHLPLTLGGRLRAGEYRLPGDVSSQYISGLLLAMPLLGASARIRLTSPLQSAGYVDMTCRTMARFGAAVQKAADGWYFGGGRYTAPAGYTPKGDWSAAAFWLTAGALAGPVTVTGLPADTAQGDAAIVTILRRFGAAVTVTGDSVTVSPAPLSGCTVDLSDTPDLLPPLAVLAAASAGKTVFTGAARCRTKECDRLHAMAAMLHTLGIAAEETPDGLTVRGGQPHSGGTVDGCGDHRIVMAAALAAALCDAPLTVTDREAVAKSYPSFFEDYRLLGGTVCE